MKTSFAKVFKDLSENKQPKDLVYPERESVAKVTQDNKPIDAQMIFVVESYDEGYTPKKQSTLLVNRKLKQEYDQIHTEIDQKEKELLEKLSKSSEIRNSQEIEKEISRIFMQDEENKLPDALQRVEKEVSDPDRESKYHDISYNKIFNEKSEKFFKQPEVKKDIEEYMKTYNSLIEQSQFFKKGIFNQYQAAEIAEQLKKNGFFKASHSVFLNGKDGKIEVANEQELIKIIEQEKQNILSNQALQDIFNKIDGKLNRNKELRGFREYLSENEFILAELENLSSFKSKLWIDYLKQEKDLFKEIITHYNSAKERIKEINEQARKEKTKWSNVIDIFNKRFHVPFRLSVDNITDVIFREESPSVKFEFKELSGTPESKRNIEKDELLKILSQGEKRALYILNIIFEVEARREAEQRTLFIIDDIADSFDYQNKYAIIEYLRDISKDNDFYQIILSHNFDFHRTVSSRLSIGRENRLNIIRTSDEIKFGEEYYQNNPFQQWRTELGRPEILIASIPFARNLAEYSGNNSTSKMLTSFLHMKDKTGNLKIKCLKTILCDVLKEGTEKICDNLLDTGYLEILYKTVDEIKNSNNSGMKLEKKIVLAIAIRLRAEDYILKKIPNQEQIESNQTSNLIDNYKNNFPEKNDNIDILEQVNLMTPENIHFNAFMFEPILDMSGEHLSKLYCKISDLQ